MAVNYFARKTGSQFGLFKQAGETVDVSGWSDERIQALVNAGVLGMTVNPPQQAFPTNLVTTDTAQAVTGAKNFTAATNTTTPLVVRGAVGQTAAVQQWQRSDGAVLADVGFDGGVTVRGGLLTAEQRARVRAGGAADSALLVDSFAGQTAPLTQWRNDAAAVIASVTSNGSISTVGRVGAGGLSAMPVDATVQAQPQAGAQVGLVVRGHSAQHVDLVQLQRSDGGTLLTVAPDGATAVRGPLTAEQRLIARTPAAAQNALIVDGFTAQTAPLTIWRSGDTAAVIAQVNANGEVEVTGAGRGVILKSPNGTRYRITVSDTGALTTAAA